MNATDAHALYVIFLKIFELEKMNLKNFKTSLNQILKEHIKYLEKLTNLSHDCMHIQI